MKTVTQLQAAVGRRLMYSPGWGLFFAVTVKDARECFGRTDYLVQPEAGAGAAWVNADRCKDAETASRQAPTLEYFASLRGGAA